MMTDSTQEHADQSMKAVRSLCTCRWGINQAMTALEDMQLLKPSSCVYQELEVARTCLAEVSSLGTTLGWWGRGGGRRREQEASKKICSKTKGEGAFLMWYKPGHGIFYADSSSNIICSSCGAQALGIQGMFDLQTRVSVSYPMPL